MRFITAYDYRTRFGRLGAIVDRVAFRPLLGWATAWSFDRLRLWLEQGIPPAVSLRAAAVHGLARLALAVTFAWHGLVPKLIGRDADEVAMLANLGLGRAQVDLAIVSMGVAEVVLAICLLAFWHRRWPILAVAAFANFALVAVAATSPGYLGGAFGPVTLTLGILALAGVDLLVLPMAPNAGRCRRRPAEPST